MGTMRTFALVSLVLTLLHQGSSDIGDGTPAPPYSIFDEDHAKTFLNDYNEEAQEIISAYVSREWNYNTNLTDHNQELVVQAQLVYSEWQKTMRSFALQYNQTNFSFDTKRQLGKILYIGHAALEDPADVEELANLISGMEARYSTGKPCDDEGNCYSLNPDLYRIISTSRDYEELKWVWKAWRDEVGAPAREDYTRYVELKNKAARANDQPDAGAYWRSYYEVDNLPEIAQKLYEELKPLYLNLHAYVRRKLYNQYGDKINLRGPLPAHVLGNMWAQTWTNIYDICEPYPGKSSPDITPELQRQNKTALDLFQISDEFFGSLGLFTMPEEFWNHSMIEKPDDRDVVCHASAWDFYNGKDFRIKQCTDITMDDFITVHHEMGHVEYYLQYKNLPVVYRRGGNPGFHEAVGDVLALSVATPKHLNTIGLLPNIDEDEQADINFLMSMALEKIAFLPFGYLMDQWRWGIFDGSTQECEYNTDWWKLRLKYQGIVPPVERSEADFDPGAKFHIPADVPYIRYFISFVLQFQFQEALCNAAGEMGPLHKCDIYQSTEAGTLLANMLSKGSSEPWPDALQAIAGTDVISAKSIIEYFDPLIRYLETVNQANGDILGWPDSPEYGTSCGNTPPAPNSIADVCQAKAFLDDFNEQGQVIYSMSSFKAWAYYTNITEHNRQAMIAASLESAEFAKCMRGFALAYDQTDFDFDTKRQLGEILYIGSAALEDQSDLEELQNLKSRMNGRYSVGTPCDDQGNCYSLEPDLTRIMATSRDYEELKWVWQAWRDEVGAPAREDYSRYVELKNMAAQANDQPDAGAYWRSYYEVDNLPEIAQTLYEELKPLYDNLHAYVRRKLYDVYGCNKINLRGPIPAHILGNMWSQSWTNIYDLCEPFPGKSSPDITPELVRQNKTALDMFKISDEFFDSLGLFKMPEEFWNHSMIVKPEGRDVVCHASAWDFSNQKDFRIKQCTDITMDDFITIHHEMGHIEYFLQYKDLPLVYRGGANPGFHEAVGDVLALSVSTPKHLKSVGLLTDVDNDEQADLNYLMSIALDKIAFLPFGYLMDQWRWGVFDGSTRECEYNRDWWKLRLQYQGIVPPVDRTEADFDPGAKYHIPADVPYIRYFISFVLQFQFHESLCEAAGDTGPLHQCDIYRSKEAGTLLANMLMKGSSEPWPVALEAITGTQTISAKSIIKYFQPLIEYMEEVNLANGDILGWPDAPEEIVPAIAECLPTQPMTTDETVTLLS